jgi:hypothetical protein
MKTLWPFLLFTFVLLWHFAGPALAIGITVVVAIILFFWIIAVASWRLGGDLEDRIKGKPSKYQQKND